MLECGKLRENPVGKTFCNFLESNVVFFLKLSYLILLIKVLVIKSYLP